jgi:hypothetical protein
MLRSPIPHEVEEWLRSLQRALIEEPDPVEVNTEGTLRGLLVVDQEQEVVAELVVTDLVGSAPVVLRQMLHGFDVTLLGPGSQAPQL